VKVNEVVTLRVTKACGGRRFMPPLIFNLRTREKCAVSFTRRPLFLVGQSPRYALNKRLPGLQIRTGELWIKAGFLKSLATKFWTVAPNI
jgi:hypothetical protein